jgi:hypothetical protein
MARKNKSTVSVNFKGVEGKGARVKPGEHSPCQLKEATLEDGNKAKYIHWVFENEEGASLHFNTSLSKNSLWNLRGLLEAMGQDVPDEEMEIDLKQLVEDEVEIGLVVEMGEYNGKPRPEVVDYFPADGDSKNDDKNNDKKGKKKKSKKDDAEKLVKSDVEDMDRDDLLKLNEEHDLELDEDDYKDNKKGLSKLLEAVLEKLDEKDLLEEEKKDKKKSKKGDDKLERSKVEDMDQDELADVIKDHKLKVDLDDFKTLPKMVKAVLAELEEKDLLED